MHFFDAFSNQIIWVSNGALSLCNVIALGSNNNNDNSDNNNDYNHCNVLYISLISLFSAEAVKTIASALILQYTCWMKLVDKLFFGMVQAESML